MTDLVKDTPLVKGSRKRTKKKKKKRRRKKKN